MVQPQIDEPISLEPYNEGWPHLYENEVSRLTPSLSIFQPEFAHFGSTAVAGMIAKPIIDILMGIDFVPPTNPLVQTLIQDGYEYFGEAGIKGRHYFRKRGQANFNVAVVRKGGQLWRDNLAIRDYLRCDPEAASAYESEKRVALKNSESTLVRYSEEKNQFMRDLLLRACTKN